MPVYEFECFVRDHHYEGVRALDSRPTEPCEGCEKDGYGYGLAHRVMSAAGVHIPSRAVARKFHDDTIKFAENALKTKESKARKVQPLR